MTLDLGSVTQSARYTPSSPPPVEPAPSREPTPLDAATVQARVGSLVDRGAALRELDGLTGDRRTSDALAGGFLSPEALAGAAPALAQGPATAALAAAAAPACTVEVRFTPVAGGLANHAFVTTTDADATTFYRGGPSAGGPSSGPSGQLGSGTGGTVSGSSNPGVSGSGNSSPSANGSSPGASRGGPAANNGPWGPIRTDFGDYLPGTVDYTDEPSGRQTVAVTPGNCDAIDRRLTGHAMDIHDARIPYNPLDANSNATARELLERSGLPQVEPVVRAPGWGTQLPGPPR